MILFMFIGIIIGCIGILTVIAARDAYISRKEYREIKKEYELRAKVRDILAKNSGSIDRELTNQVAKEISRMRVVK